MIIDKIEGLLEKRFLEDEWKDCYVIEIIQSGKKLEVYMDCDSQLTLRKCQRISRYLEEQIDDKGWLPEDYVLEVSSPGLGRPLKFPRQYRKQLGRQLKISMVDGSTHEGTLTDAGVEECEIEVTLSKRQQKEQGKKTNLISLRYDDIKQTKIKVSFK